MLITTPSDSGRLTSDDFISGPRTFTISQVEKVTEELDGKQKTFWDISLEGEELKWLPAKTVLRALVKAWETNKAEEWVGRRLTLYRDGSVRIGKEEVGGIRVSHVSGIDKTTMVTVRSGRGRAKFTFAPLPDEPQPDTGEQITDDQWATISEHLEAAGYSESASRAAWVQENLDRQISSPKAITKDEADRMLADLTGKEQAA